MDFRIIELPAFTAASSGADTHFDFSGESVLGKFDRYFSAIAPSPRDSFMPRDFLFFDPVHQGLVWWWALAEGMDDGGYERVAFDGGYYLCCHYRDGDEEAGDRLYREALDYIRDSRVFELDERPNHYTMGHIITPKAIAQAQGFSVMETFIPIKIREGESA